MKSKKMVIIFIVIILILAAIIIGMLLLINKKSNSKNIIWEQKISDFEEYPIVGTLIDSFDEKYNVKLNKLRSYDFEKFYFGNRGRTIFWFTNSQLYTLKDFNNLFPVEHIEIIDPTHICVIYKLERSDKEYTYAYIVFERIVKKTEQNTDYESWWKTGETYFVENLTSSKAFESVKAGDSAFDVNKIDNGISFDADYDSGSGKAFTSYRLLSDGIMLIEFKNDLYSEDQTSYFISDSESGLKNFKVEKISFYPYGGESVPTLSSVPFAEGKKLSAFSSPNLVKSGR